MTDDKRIYSDRLTLDAHGVEIPPIDGPYKLVPGGADDMQMNEVPDIGALIEAFDQAAQYWGWAETEASGDLAAVAEAEYEAAKAALLNALKETLNA